MARSLSKQFNKIVKQRLNDVKASPEIKKMAFSMVEDRIEAARSVLEKDFNEHEVTQSLETRSLAKSLGKKASFFEFLGFQQGDNPTKIIRKAFSPQYVSLVTGSGIARRSGKNITYNFKVKYPSMEEIYAVTPANFSGGRSWVKMVQRGVPGGGSLSYTLARFEQGDFNNSKSGSSIQSEYVVRNADYKGQPYVDEMLLRFRASIAGRSKKGTFI